MKLLALLPALKQALFLSFLLLFPVFLQVLVVRWLEDFVVLMMWLEQRFLWFEVEMEKRPTIDDILRLNVIRNRIYNFLKEVEYDQDLHSTMAKQYKEERKKKIIKKNLC